MNQTVIQVRSLLLALLTGIITGLIVGAFRIGIQMIAHFNFDLLLASQTSFKSGLIFCGVFLALALFAGYCVSREPDIGGSGIPQVAGQISGQLHQKWYRVLFFKFFGGLATIGSGLTLGREGPSVQIGATIGQGIGQISNSSRRLTNALIAGAAGGGLAAAFNAPLSGLIFIVEELYHRTGRNLFLYGGLTVISAAITANKLLGINPSIPIPRFIDFDVPNLFLSIILGCIIGFSGVLFNYLIIHGKMVYGKWQVPAWAKALLPFAVTACFLFLDLRLYGSGDELIQFPFGHNESLLTLIYLYLVKLILLVLAFCSGIPGGIFFPLLAIGSLVGNIYGSFLHEIGIVSAEVIPYFAVLAMSSHFSAIVRAPLTGIILIAEMTGASLPWLLPIIIASYTAHIVADFLGSPPIYTSLLDLLLQDRKASQLSESIKSEGA